MTYPVVTTYMKRFVQKSDSGFPDFTRTKSLLSQTIQGIF